MTYAEKLQADLINIFESDDFGIFEEEKVYKVEKHSEYQSKVDTLVAINEFYVMHQEPSLKAARGSEERRYALQLKGLRRDKDEFLKEYDEFNLIFQKDKG